MSGISISMNQVLKMYPKGRKVGYSKCSVSGMWFVFPVGTCDRCGGEVEEPNGVNLSKSVVDSLRAAGREVQFYETHPHEIDIDNETGEYFCTGCPKQ